MWNLTFDSSDIFSVLFLALLEITLSADNVIILALLIARLPSSLRPKALLIGTLSAFVFRGLALFFIQRLIEHEWVELVGAVYLIYLSLRYFAKKGGQSITPHGGNNFWKTILLIELFDLAFAVDSILAGVAFVTTNVTSHLASKIWIVYTGGMLGLIGIRYTSHLFSNLLYQFPRFQRSAYLMIGWIGLKLGYYTLFHPPFSLEPIFWTGMAFFLLLGFGKEKRKA